MIKCVLIAIVMIYYTHCNGDSSVGMKVTKNNGLHEQNYKARPLLTNPGATLTSQSGLIGQGFSVISPQIQMLWLIQPSNPTSQTIQFVFQALNINSAQLQVYDSTAAQSGTLLFNCVGCGNIIPPPFFSTTGAVYVSVAGFAGSPFQASTFSIQFVSQPGSRAVQLNNITINLNAGYGKLSPQQLNGVVPSNSIQRWVISTPGSSPITFSLSNFQFDSSCASTLQIFDDVSATTGNLIFSGCKSADASRSWLYSTTGKALVVYTSGVRDSSNVFLLTYVAYTELYNCGAFLQPDNLGDDSMILTDGSARPNFMRRGQQCTWLISPKSAGTITLVLRWVSLKSGSSVVVYDGSTSSANILWNGVGPTYVTPPLLTSSGNSMYLVFTANTFISNGYYGFRGEYLTNYYGSTGIGSGVSLLSMSSALDIIPPGDPMYCTPAVTYTWNILPSQVNGPLTFVVTSLNLSSTSQLIIYDGATAAAPVLAKYSGSKTPFQWLKTSTSVATMQFKSAASIGEKQGNFKVSYYGDGNSYNCGFPSSRVASVVAYSSSIFDGTAYDSQALPNQQCSWNISPPRASAVYLFFSYFSLAGGTLQIYMGSVSSGQLIATISGPAVPSPMLVQGGTVGITYTTGNQVMGNGFSASYYGVSSSYFYGPGDGLVQLRSSSLSGLTLTVKTSSGLLLSPRSSSNFTWIISPNNAQGSIFIAFSRLNLSTRAILEVYDGANMSSPLLASYSGKSLWHPYQWLQTRSTAALITVMSPQSQPLTNADFSLSYYANGNSFQCGYGLGSDSAGGVTTLTAPSMIITDGSAIASVMLASQSCQWRILRPTNATAIVLEFMSSDLRGGQLVVYDGPNANSALLWRCSSCIVLPRTLVSYSKSVYLAFSSGVAPVGTGFQAVYWTSYTSRIYSPANGTFLDLPAGYQLDSSKSNTSTVWKLSAVSATNARLTFFPRLVARPVSTMSEVSDGRPSTRVFPAPQTQGFTCGSVVGAGTAPRYALSGSDVYQAATQAAASYVISSAMSTQVKTLLSMEGSWDTSQPQSSTGMFQPARVCKYLLDSGSTQSVIININRFASASIARLQVLGGINGNDAVLFDSAAARSASSVVAPCGKSLVILDYNTSLVPSLSSVDFGFDLTFTADPADKGGVCIAYIISLQPKVKKTNPWIKVYIGCGVAAFVVLTGIGLYCFRRHLPDVNWKWSSRPAYQTVTPNYPRYTPKLDELRNKFLATGQCCVCSEPQNIIRLSCHHGICVEDIKGYLESALGNIALFPVKCPMHYEACEGGINASIAKRVLSRTQYDRFIEFSDRALYGEGMRCIFCNNFVNYPESSALSMVECPYCVQRFCIRCKKPWHYGARCPLDNVDDSLEAWKMDSGAQKCPACHKLIEKDDPDTCNHMVHKITDGIPCVRDRTDFCYCCGEEVAPDYPHDEIQNPGVNHFPDGVFQKCRIIVKKEQDAERERLKRLRRMKNKPKSPQKKTQVASMDGWDSDDDGTTARNPAPAGVPAAAAAGAGEVASLAVTGDRFDDQWNQMLGSPTASVSSAGASTSITPGNRLGVAVGGGGVGVAGNGSAAAPAANSPLRRAQGQTQGGAASPSGRRGGRGTRTQGAARAT